MALYPVVQLNSGIREMLGSGHRQHQHQQRVNGHRRGGSRDIGRDIVGTAQSGADYDEDWDDDVYYAPAAKPRELQITDNLIVP